MTGYAREEAAVESLRMIRLDGLDDADEDDDEDWDDDDWDDDDDEDDDEDDWDDDDDDEDDDEVNARPGREVSPHYDSARSASTGSVLAARRAGSQLATAAMKATETAATT
jgi:hypothetical protein